MSVEIHARDVAVFSTDRTMSVMSSWSTAVASPEPAKGAVETQEAVHG